MFSAVVAGVGCGAGVARVLRCEAPKAAAAVSRSLSPGPGVGGGATYVIHELLAHGADLLGQRGAEHHHLLVVGGHLEDLLDVHAHVCEGKERKQVRGEKRNRERETVRMGKRRQTAL